MKHIFYFFLHISLLSIIFSLFLTSCSEDKKNINDWNRMNLKGRIKQIDLLKYPTYEDLRKNKNAQKSFIRFTDNGLIIKSATFIKSNLIHWMKYQYYGNSVWIDESKELDNKVNQIQAHWLYKINDQGAQVEVTAYFIDSTINYHIDAEIDADGKTTEITYSQQRYPDRIPCRISKIYDDNRNLKEELSYRYNKITRTCEKTPTRSTFTVNEQGDIVREVIHTKDGRKRPPHSYKLNYDKKDNWIEKIHYTGDYTNEVIIRKFTYFPDNNNAQ
jgi:hypothetical protein